MPQFHFVADQRFETVMGGLNPSLELDLSDPETIGTFLKTHWDTDDRDHALEHWDPEIDGEMPPLGPEWDTHPIDGQDLPVNPTSEVHILYLLQFAFENPMKHSSRLRRLHLQSPFYLQLHQILNRNALPH